MSIKTIPELNASLLRTHKTDIQRGVEKEGLRVVSDKTIAQTPHPAALGSALTHPSITTDYSEALLEFITPVMNTADGIQFLQDLHAYTCRNIGGEVIWPGSMPCLLNGDKSIPIAQYGSSNIGTMKHVYRRGLGVRYGRVMQSIAGIHYNFSVSDQFWQAYRRKIGSNRVLKDFKSAQYFCLIRNFKRNAWLLFYLFGASPVLDRSFLEGRRHNLVAISEQTYGLPFATSLRMSDLGYQNSSQEAVSVSYDSLDAYIETLGQVVEQPHPDFEKKGVKVNGKYRQLNSNILQLENEFYSDIRPKRVSQSDEKPLLALKRAGVEYIEVRVLDINPFLPVGIDEQEIAFLDAFLIYCLLSGDSNNPVISEQQAREIRQNQWDVIHQGRDPSLHLVIAGANVPMDKAANSLLDVVNAVALLMDEAEGSSRHSDAVTAQRAKVADASLTPSGKVMALINDGADYVDIMQAQALKYKQYWLEYDLDESFCRTMQAQASTSLQAQRQIEASDKISFDAFLAGFCADDPLAAGNKAESCLAS